MSETNGDDVVVIVQTAILFNAPPAAMAASLNTAFERRGWADRPAEFRRGNEYVHIDVYDTVGEQRFLVIRAESSLLGVVRSVARDLSVPLEAHEVQVREEVVHSPNGDMLYWARIRSVEVTSDGTSTDIDGPFDLDDGGANHGDAWETADHLTFEMIDIRLRRHSELVTSLDFYRTPGADPLSPRLRNLVVLAEEAKSLCLTEVMGQKAVRIVFADGTTQMSVVSDEDLVQIQEYVSLSP